MLLRLLPAPLAHTENPKENAERVTIGYSAFVDEERWGMKLEKRILRLHKGGTGILKIGKELDIGTGTVQRLLMEQPRPFDVGVAEASFASQ